MEPKFDFCLDASIKQQSDGALLYLAKVKKVVNDYASSLESMLCDGNFKFMP